MTRCRDDMTRRKVPGIGWRGRQAAKTTAAPPSSIAVEGAGAIKKLRKGAPVPVIYNDQLPFTLNYQREATVVRVDGDELYLSPGNPYPPSLELGPIPAVQL